MASEVLCGRCGALLMNPASACPRCGAPASGGFRSTAFPQRKNPLVAATLALIPGCGHFYLGHNLKGIGLLVGIAGFQLFDTSLDLTGVGALLGVPLELGPGTLWVYSIIDAYRTAKHMEREAGFSA
jgi:TM2 domain-containing membrane protein YozV